ncbi:hypothetical protein [Streptomyces sp. LARHCF252]
MQNRLYAGEPSLRLPSYPYGWAIVEEFAQYEVTLVEDSSDGDCANGA